MQHRVGVAKTLSQPKPGPEERVVDAKYLRHATRPSDPLSDVRRQALCRQSRGLRYPQVGHVVAPAAHLQRGVGVLGDGLYRDPADLHQWRAPQHRAGAAEEGGVPQVVAMLHQTVKQFGLVRNDPEGIQVAFKRIRRVEEMRRLQHRQFGVVQEGAQRQLQERPRRHMVAIENRYELAVGARERRVQVAGLGVLVVAAGEIACAGLLTKALEHVSAAIVEYMDAQLVRGPVHRLRCQHRPANHVERLVVGWYEDVNGRPQPGVGGKRFGLAPQRQRGLHIAQQQDHQRIELGRHQSPAQHRAYQVVEVQRAAQAPEHVPQRAGHRQRDQEHRAQRPCHLVPDPQCRREGDETKAELLLGVQRHCDYQCAQDRRDYRG